MFRLPWKSKNDTNSQKPTNAPSKNATPEDKYKQDLERLNTAHEEKTRSRRENIGLLRTIRRETDAGSESRSPSYIGNPFRDESPGIEGSLETSSANLS